MKKEFPSPEDILEASDETLSMRIKELCKSRSNRWADEKALQLIEAAARNPFEKTVYQSHTLTLGMLFTLFFNPKSTFPHWN